MMEDSSDSDLELEYPTARQLRRFQEIDSYDSRPATDQSGEPVAGPSGLQPPVAGPSGLQPPVAGAAGPSRRKGHLPDFPSSSSESDFDPIEHRWNYKNQKRRKVPYQSMKFKERTTESSDESDNEEYVLSPPSNSENPETIFMNSNFEVRLKRIAHSKHSQFNYSDHLYSMTFNVRKSGKSFKLTKCFSLLNAALLRALENISGFYNKSYENQIYTTIIQHGLLNGLNSGGYSLATPPQTICNHMLNMLENFLQSNENLTFDKSFQIQFKVLSRQHVSHRILNDPKYVVHVHESEMPGNPKRDYPEYIFSFSEFCWTHLSNCFTNMCFYLAIILSIARYDFNAKSDLLTYPEIISSQSQKSTGGCDLLHKLLRNMQSEYEGISWQNMLSMISKARKLQFHIFDADMNYSFLSSYPSQFSFGFNPIYLCFYENRTHLTVISDYAKFCAKNKKYHCFSCSKCFKSKKSFQHRCPKMNTCFACCRPVYQITYVRQACTTTFCDSEVAKASEIEIDTCQKCNLTTKTKSCQSFHKKVCSQGAKFLCCNKFFYNSSFPNQSDLKKIINALKKSVHSVSGIILTILRPRINAALRNTNPSLIFLH